MPVSQDPYMALLEKTHGAALTPALRKALRSQLKELDKSLTVLRSFPLTEGGSEPSTMFIPEWQEP